MPKKKEEITFDSEAFLRNVSRSSGVYIMLDTDENCLYVGKAKNLRNRLTTYFSTRNLPGKTRLLVEKINKIDIINTQTNHEALIVEHRLIKEKRPRYNIVFRDDKSYPYINVSTDHPYPSITFYRGRIRKNGQFFGPYSSVGAARNILSQIQKLIPVRQCSNSYFSNRSRPCLQYQIKRCSAPCVNFITKSAYHQDVKEVIMLLKGQSNLLSKIFEQRMMEASYSLDYEMAANYRNRISALRELQSRQGNIFPKNKNIDVFGLDEMDGVVVICILFIRFGDINGHRYYTFRPTLGEDSKMVLEAFIPQFYSRNTVPHEIIVPSVGEINREIPEYLMKISEHKIEIKTNVRGKRAKALANAHDQAMEYLERYKESRENYRNKFNALYKTLGIRGTIESIECYDVSHISGNAIVGSKVVFNKMGPDRSQYRRFNIKTVKSGDDYGAIKDMLERRLKKVHLNETMATLPGVILVDGGRGQLNIAKKIIENLGLEKIAIAGIAKGHGRNPKFDKIYVIENEKPKLKILDKVTMNFVQEIRNEAHRFALTGHRRKRSLANKHSILEDIEGVGAKRRRALLVHFGGLTSIQNASAEEISRVKGISANLAQTIYQSLRK